MFTQKKDEESMEQGSEEKNFKLRKKMKTFKFYLQVLVLVKTEMQMQLTKY